MAVIQQGVHSVFAETQQFFIKQRAAIDKLRADNELLKEEVQLENKFSVKPTTNSAAALIRSLEEQSDAYTAKIGEERLRNADLARQVDGFKASIAERRTQMGGINAAQETELHLRKGLNILENRLEKAYHRANARRAATVGLRDGIDGLRKERLAFAEQLRKLGVAAEAHRGAAAQLLRASHVACEGRDKALAAIGALKLAGDRETAAAEAEWRQLTQLIEHDRKRKEAQRERELAVRAQSTVRLLRDEQRGKREQRKTVFAQAASGVPGLSARLQALTAALGQVGGATGTASVDALVADLSAREDSNFRLFGYVGEVNADTEILQERQRSLQAEIDKLKGMTAAQEAQRAQQLQDLEANLAATEAAAQAGEEQREAADTRCCALKEGVAALWARVGPRQADAVISELLGEGGAHVSDTNLMQHLGLIEQRANELLLEQGGSVGQARQEGAGGQEQRNPNPQAAADDALAWDPAAEAPSTLAEFADAADGTIDDLPLSLEVLRVRAELAVARRVEHIQAIRTVSSALGGPGANTGSAAKPGRPGGRPAAKKPPSPAGRRRAGNVD